MIQLFILFPQVSTVGWLRLRRVEASLAADCLVEVLNYVKGSFRGEFRRKGVVEAYIPGVQGLCNVPPWQLPPVMVLNYGLSFMCYSAKTATIGASVVSLASVDLAERSNIVFEYDAGWEALWAEVHMTIDQNAWKREKPKDTGLHDVARNKVNGIQPAAHANS